MSQQAAAPDQVKPSTCCPHCHEPIGLDMVARAASEATLSYRITPKEGHLLDIETIGGTLNALSKLLKSAGRDMDAKTTVLLKQAITHPNGEIQFDVLIARVAKMTK